MAEEIGFENGRNSNFQGLVTLTLTLDPAIWHTVVHHSSTSTYIQNFIEIEETSCGRTDGRTDIFPPVILLGRLLEVDLIMQIFHVCSKLTSSQPSPLPENHYRKITKNKKNSKLLTDKYQRTAIKTWFLQLPSECQNITAYHQAGKCLCIKCTSTPHSCNRV